MPTIKRTALFGKLNTACYHTVEGATVFCKMRGNPYVELVHWIQQLVQSDDNDLSKLLPHYKIDAGRMAAQITQNLDELPRGATAISDFSPHLEDAVKQAWVFSTLLFGFSHVRSGTLIYAILETPSLKQVLLGISAEFAKIKTEDLSQNFNELVAGSAEDQEAAKDGSSAGTIPGQDSNAVGPAAMGKGEALAKFTTDMTQQAEDDKLEPILGRDEEIRQIMDILLRKRQNNPILTGEAGVGKTAVVEGFAQRIARGDVPPALKGVRLLALDMGLLQAGASMKGEFENRLRQVIEEVQSSETPIIMFIDEAHTLIGAGGAEGQNDAANLLKPALARGTLRTIAATTWAEYKKYFEKDPALTRRFQVVKIEEPDVAKATIMIRGQMGRLEAHHKISILDEAVVAAVALSHKYIPARQLPDKAVSLIDTACARVAITQHSTPAEIEDLGRRVDFLETELRILTREEKTGADHSTRKDEISKLLEECLEKNTILKARWDQENNLVKEISELKTELRKEPTDGEDAEEGKESAPTEKDSSLDNDELISTLREKEAALAELQGEVPLIHPEVDENAVAAVVADWTGIPVGRMVKDEIKAVLDLVNHLEKRVIGQTHALEAIAKRIQTSRAKLDNPNKPIGVFLLAGTSGVGKTETALALAETLYGGEGNMITINMSEFQEAHTVSTLKGAPPGYVGYGEGGVLTEAVRRRPYSVVLLDEVEKAHSDVHEIFFQVFDKGLMEDGEGRIIDFKNTIIILTTNAGTDMIDGLCKDPELMPEVDAIASALRNPLMEVFPPALLGRMITVPFFPLAPDVLRQIIILQLARVVKRVKENHKAVLSYDDAVVELMLSRCTETESGGRMIDAILTNTLLPAMSHTFLGAMMEGRDIKTIAVSVEDSEFVYTIGD
ncbi:MAG: type VI secretion system ATPase TssH [Opitutaceae bacterium]